MFIKGVLYFLVNSSISETKIALTEIMILVYYFHWVTLFAFVADISDLTQYFLLAF